MRYTVFITSSGAPATGLTPTIAALRGADGTAPGIATPTVSEVDAVYAPGWYAFEATPTKTCVVTATVRQEIPRQVHTRTVGAGAGLIGWRLINDGTTVHVTTVLAFARLSALPGA